MDAQLEKKLIKSAARGDADAFEKLVLENERMIYALSLRMLGNEQDAQDAVQEVFLKAWRSLGSFRAESRFSVWLYRMTNNACLDMLRRRRVPSVSLTPEENETVPDIPDPSPGPQELLEDNELRRAVQSALAELPEDFRRAIVLRETAGLSYAEIALAMNIDVGTVKSRIFRARKKLCAILTTGGNIFDQSTSNSLKGGGRE